MLHVETIMSTKTYPDKGSLAHHIGADWIAPGILNNVAK